MEQSEANKDKVRYFLDEVYNKGNLAVADELVAPDYVSHNKLALEVLGPEGIKQVALLQRAAFPDLRSECLDLIAEGDKVVVRGRDTGTFSHEFMGLAPTGNRFCITWIDIFRFEAGLLKEAWLETDSHDFLKQLSAAPAEEPVSEPAAD
ncbi:MAG: ester cyclase [Candidatus Sericytochromatia bacterium]